MLVQVVEGEREDWKQSEVRGKEVGTIQGLSQRGRRTSFLQQ